MHRATPADTLHRAYDAGGSRATIESVNDKPMMQEMAGNFMKGESRKAVEAPQNYGYTSVVRDASKSQDGQLNECAEGFMMFVGGSRSFPVCAIMDDRRYRLKELEKGDVAMFDYLQHQIHLNSKGVFVTGRTDKAVKIQLAQPPQDQQSSSNGQKSLKGQTKRYDQTSKHYLEMTKDAHNLVHDQTINYKSGTHQFQPASAAAVRSGNPLVQIIGDKFTAGLGYFMKQVTAAPPTSSMHLTTKGYVDSIFAALGITIPALPTLPMPPLPPGVTLPPGITLPLPMQAVADTVAAKPSPPSNVLRLIIDGGYF